VRAGTVIHPHLLPYLPRTKQPAAPPRAGGVLAADNRARKKTAGRRRRDETEGSHHVRHVSRPYVEQQPAAFKEKRKKIPVTYGPAELVTCTQLPPASPCAASFTCQEQLQEHSGGRGCSSSSR